ncbi:MAG: efflux RND transporter periplasmic adaptor subunit [Proteiniphilum sp.]|nr:efflux RND transporter periplasmic adaptor subunit [Proteiniphilum sp.]
MKQKKLKMILLAGSVIILVAVLVLLTGGKKSVSYTTATVNKGKVETTVMATGYVQPVEVVEVGTQVSGVIEKIYVDYNSHVKKGQILAQLETNTLMEKVNQAKASLRAAQSDLSYATQHYERVKTLYEAEASTQASYEEAINRRNQAETTYENAKATLKQAEVDISYAYIYSPIEGVVLDRAVNTGQTVAAAFSTPTLFTIAEDMTKMQVEVDVDEADIGQVKVGQHVNFTVDAYPGDTFTGKVSELRLQPVVTSNVVTYTVIVNAPNPDEKLLPGMTAEIAIIVSSEKGLLVPVEALNFQMDEEVADYADIAGDIVNDNHGVWVKSGDKLERKQIVTGLGDGIFLTVRSGLTEGQEVILSASTEKNQAEKKNTNLLPAPPGGGNHGGPNGGM